MSAIIPFSASVCERCEKNKYGLTTSNLNIINVKPGIIQQIHPGAAYSLKVSQLIKAIKNSANNSDVFSGSANFQYDTEKKELKAVDEVKEYKHKCQVVTQEDTDNELDDLEIDPSAPDLWEKVAKIQAQAKAKLDQLKNKN